eukprot:2655258-Pyramimonas_sp.AAC.1
MKAFDRALRKENWLRPNSQAGQEWKGKVDWALAEQYFQLDRSEDYVDEADDEVVQKFGWEAFFQKHFPSRSLPRRRSEGPAVPWRRGGSHRQGHPCV